MESKILGIPLVLVFFVLLIGMVINIPMYLLHITQLAEIKETQRAVISVCADPLPDTTEPETSVLEATQSAVQSVFEASQSATEE